MITSFYAALLTFLFAKISIDTIKARHAEKVSLGPGEQNQIIHMVSAHSNFASYVPFFLILLFLCETQRVPTLLLHFISISFVTGRVFHFLTMKNKEKTFRHRKLGMQLTLFPLLALAFTNLTLAITDLLKIKLFN